VCTSRSIWDIAYRDKLWEMIFFVLRCAPLQVVDLHPLYVLSVFAFMSQCTSCRPGWLLTHRRPRAPSPCLQWSLREFSPKACDLAWGSYRVFRPLASLLCTRWQVRRCMASSVHWELNAAAGGVVIALIRLIVPKGSPWVSSLCGEASKAPASQLVGRPRW
jgi:hypothetical protein